MSGSGLLRSPSAAKGYCPSLALLPYRGNRGDWHSFEPVAALAERYVDAFGAGALPHLGQLAEIARKSA